MFYREHFDYDEDDDDDDDDVAVLSLASSRSADSDQGYGSTLVDLSRSDSGATWSAHDKQNSGLLRLGPKPGLTKQCSAESDCALLQPYPTDYNRGDAFDLGGSSRPSSAVVSFSFRSSDSAPHARRIGLSSPDADFMTSTLRDGDDTAREPSKKKAARAKRSDAAQRLLSRRQLFHRGNHFVRARYGPRAVDNPTAKQTNFRPPSAFCAPLRYAQEPRAAKTREQKPKCARWPEPPRYPPKARHVAVDCQILHLVEQLHVAIQCQPEVAEASVWCPLRMVNASTQYPRLKYKNASVQTTAKTFSDQGVQSKPEMRNQLVETTETILYQPSLETVQGTTRCVCQTDSPDQ